MRLFVKAKPGAKKEFVRKIDETHFVIAVKEPPHEGRANEAIRRKIAEYLRTPLSNVAVVSGQGSRDKIFEMTYHQTND